MIRLGNREFDQNGGGFIIIEEVKSPFKIEITEYGDEFHGRIFSNDNAKVEFYHTTFTFVDYAQNMTKLIDKALELMQQ
jgi:hypothetical protein